MSEIKADTDEEQFEKVNDRIVEAVTPKLEGSSSVLEKMIAHFGQFDVDQARRELGRRLLGDEAYLALERLAMGVTFSRMQDIESLSDEQLLLLSQAFTNGGLAQDAVNVLEHLRQRDLEQVDASTIEDLEKLARSQLPSHQWDDKVALDWQSSQLRPRGLGMITSSRRIMRTEVAVGESFRGWQLITEGSAIAMRDANGQVIGMPSGSLVRRDDGDRDAKIHGGVMLLVRQGQITAVDLYKIRGNQGIESILWHRNFSGDGSVVASRRSMSTKFGVMYYRYQLTSSKGTSSDREFRVGTILGDRVFVLQGGELMAVDLATSKTLWRNSTAPISGAVVSDGQRVAVVSKDKIVSFDVFDGRNLSEHPWEYGEIWLSAGRNLLCYAPTDDPFVYKVRIVNPFTREILHETDSLTSNRGAKDDQRGFGRIVNDRYMILLDTKGNLTVWDVHDGRAISSLKTQAYSDLNAVHGIELDGQLIVFPSRLESIANLPGKEQTKTQQSTTHQTVHALYALSLDDGSLRWEREFEEPWGCTVSQPGKTPLLVLNRLRWVINSNGPRTMRMDTNAVDVRDGKTLHERLGTVVSPRLNELQTKVVVQPVQERVIAQVGGEVLTYKFGETDPEPDPDTPSDKATDADAPPSDNDDDADPFGR
ncbi:MAG: PQQ-binding-like beta-propeller repeat protein [Pirellulaceae bacterium]|nr:PQQ-binding-like beta-propeller repeat protein [Pirellulaceae bacterium]